MDFKYNWFKFVTLKKKEKIREAKMKKIVFKLKDNLPVLRLNNFFIALRKDH